MGYSGGTIAAQTCIQKLSEQGALVDVYSSVWLSAHPDFPDFNVADLEEYQSRSRNMCEGHLLIISTSLDDEAVSTLLPAAYPLLTDVVNPKIGNHKPDLIFLNLATQQILWVGLGRKNQLFGFAVGAEDVHLRDGNIEEVTQADPVRLLRDLFGLQTFAHEFFALVAFELFGLGVGVTALHFVLLRRAGFGCGRCRCRCLGA